MQRALRDHDPNQIDDEPDRQRQNSDAMKRGAPR
jgi:hypothetical protein